MKTAFVVLLSALCLMTAGLTAGEVNALVIGSTEPFAEKRAFKALDEQAIVNLARMALQAEFKVRDRMNIVFEDVFRKKPIGTAIGQAGRTGSNTYRCHSLAQWYFWPEGREERLVNLRGEGKKKWDYVLIMGDPYLIWKMPGMYAEGVALVVDSVKKGGAKPVLLMPWVAEKSDKIASMAEVVCRVAEGAGITAVPTWYADKIRKQCDGAYSVPNPFAMKYVDKRSITYNHTGSSSERGIERALKAATVRCSVNARKVSPEEAKEMIDFNYGRGNSILEPSKQYKVDPKLFERSYGFPMQDHSKTATESMLYGIDKRNGDGTDLGIAWDMIRQDEVRHDVRCVPIRLMWAKMHDADPALAPLGDRWHMSGYLHNCSGTFIYTLLSGRCPMNEKPSKDDQKAWRHWIGQKIGYETAWRMSHLTARVPGFAVKPLDEKTTLSPDASARLAVKLHYTPNANVTVAVSTDKPGVTAEPATLTFTPQNHGNPQEVTLTGGKVAADTAVRVMFVTASKDKVFDQLRDAWTYTATAK